MGEAAWTTLPGLRGRRMDQEQQEAQRIPTTWKWGLAGWTRGGICSVSELKRIETAVYQLKWREWTKVRPSEQPTELRDFNVPCTMHVSKYFLTVLWICTGFNTDLEADPDPSLGSQIDVDPCLPGKKFISALRTAVGTGNLRRM